MSCLTMHIPWNPSPSQLRQFSLLLIAFGSLLAGWLVWRDHTPLVPLGVLAAALGLGLVGWRWPGAIRGLYVVWMAAVFPIGWLVSHLLLGAVFYLVFAPVGFMMWACGYDPLHRRWDPRARTYWRPRGDREDTDRYFKQY